MQIGSSHPICGDSSGIPTSGIAAQEIASIANLLANPMEYSSSSGEIAKGFISLIINILNDPQIQSSIQSSPAYQKIMTDANAIEQAISKGGRSQIIDAAHDIAAQCNHLPPIPYDFFCTALSNQFSNWVLVGLKNVIEQVNSPNPIVNYPEIFEIQGALQAFATCFPNEFVQPSPPGPDWFINSGTLLSLKDLVYALSCINPSASIQNTINIFQTGISQIYNVMLEGGLPNGPPEGWYAPNANE